jgi:hypothetical protein
MFLASNNEYVEVYGEYILKTKIKHTFHLHWILNKGPVDVMETEDSISHHLPMLVECCNKQILSWASFEKPNQQGSSYCWNGPFWATDHLQGSEGMVLFLSPHLQCFVVDYGRDPKDQCVWIALLVQDILLGFCAMYAPTSLCYNIDHHFSNISL